MTYQNRNYSVHISNWNDNTIFILVPCETDLCGTNAECSVNENGEKVCSCPESFPQGDPLSGCYGTLSY